MKAGVVMGMQTKPTDESDLDGQGNPSDYS
jgi:hypothetical protein